MTYQQMASVYDHFMADAPYDDWVYFTTEIVKNKKVKRIIDLGCGTGEITIRMSELGYDLVGLDYSEEMLTYAAQKAYKKRLPITWLQQDLTKMEGLTDFDLAISYCDVINYITEEKDIANVFERTFKSLNSGGTFIFDVHSMYQVEANYKNSTFAEVLDEMSYIWFCSEGDEKGEMYHDLTFFVHEKNNSYQRFDETHHQRTYPIPFYEKLLSEAGFTNIKVYADFSFEWNQNQEQMERIFFVAEKT